LVRFGVLAIAPDVIATEYAEHAEVVLKPTRTRFVPLVHDSRTCPTPITGTRTESGGDLLMELVPVTDG